MPYVKSSVSFRTKSRRSRARRRRLAAILVVVAAIAGIAIALRPRAHAAAVSDRPAAPAPAHAQILYKPRAAAPSWGDVSRKDLDRELQTALAPAITGARDWSIAVIAQDGSLLYADRSNEAVEPASAEKLIVTDASLTELGPSYRFDTLLAASHPPQGGRIDGDLWLVGSGDPSLRSSDLRNGTATLRKAGVSTIDGHVVVDGSAIAGEEINSLWNPEDSNEDFMSATSGISVDEDTVEFDVTGTSPGEPAQVHVNPPSSAVKYYGSVATGDGDDVIVAATETPNVFRLDGSIPAGVEEKYWVPVHGIPQYAGAVADAMLRGEGISVDRPAATGTVPIDSRVLWVHRSQPLPILLHHMLVHSDNHFAEQFMRTLGSDSGGTPNDAGGLAVERSILSAQGIPTPGLHLVDGSGLAHADRVAAITLAGILAHFDADPHGNPVYLLLPRGGKDGTLKMYDFESAAGRVRAKSGHLSDAASLAGYVESRRHGRVVFAFMINGSPGDPDAAIVSAVDRIAER